MNRLALTLVSVVAAAGCAAPPLLEAPGAKAVAVGRTADAVALWEALGKAKLVDVKLLHELGPGLDASAPLIASLLPDGAVVVATRVNASAATLSAAAKPVVGKTSSVTLGEDTVLVRVDRDRALVAFRVPPGEESTVAAVLELMAATTTAPALVMPKPGDIKVRLAGASLPVAVGDVDATVTAGNPIVVKGRAEHPQEDVRKAFESAAPSWACLDPGAAAVISIPPFVVGEDSFSGRLVVALYPTDDGPAFAVAGTPKDAAASLSLVEAVKSAGAFSDVVDGKKHILTVENAGHPLRAVVDDQSFLLTSGATPAGAQPGGRCASATSSSLLTVRGPQLARVLLPALATPADIVRLLAGAGGGDNPLEKLRGIERLDVDVKVDGAALVLDAKLAVGASS